MTMQNAKPAQPPHQNARALPAPPAALWTFAVIFGASIAVALFGGV